MRYQGGREMPSTISGRKTWVMVDTNLILEPILNLKETPVEPLRREKRPLLATLAHTAHPGTAKRSSLMAILGEEVG